MLRNLISTLVLLCAAAAVIAATSAPEETSNGDPEAGLAACRDGERETDAVLGGVMRSVAQDVTARETEAVAEYIRGFH